MRKIIANFVSNEFSKNSIFDLSSPLNRDNCNFPFFQLREKLLDLGIVMNTSDLNHDQVDIQLALNVQDYLDDRSKNNYLLLLETPQILPANGDARNWENYNKIFTWNDDLVDEDKFIKINYPNPIQSNPIQNFGN